jgi:hypothetical protein
MLRRSVFLLFLFVPAVLTAQFRGEEPQRPSVAEGMRQSTASSGILGFFHPENLEMRHSFSVSYGMFGDQGMGVSMYTNSLRYRIAEPLTVRADISMMFSPFGSASSMFKNDLSGIFLQRASIDYVPSKDMRISLQYRNIPSSLYAPYSGRYMYPSLFGGSIFLDDEDRW